MNSACPVCFTRVLVDEARFRCSSGRCEPQLDPQASAYLGYSVGNPPTYRWTATAESPRRPSHIICRHCSEPTSLEVCTTCHVGLAQGWRDKRVMTMAITGARGSGKSVYIAVMIDTLRRYAQARGTTITASEPRVQDIFERNYYGPLFKENRVLEGTPQLESGGAYQRIPLIWEISSSSGERFTLVIRDAAGEDLERAAGETPALSYLDRADLLIFLFDSLQLPSMRQILAGIIPDVDPNRLGASAEEVLPKVLQQLRSGWTDLALTFSKFDAFHELPKANTELYAQTMANPSAHFNRDDTHRRASSAAQGGSQAELMADLEFLDAEVRSLFRLINEESVTLQADRAAQDGRARHTQHFAVSAVGETPQHADQLTERGISPFRVLDPVLWGMERRGLRL